jgi:NADH-quinone oxidoreductase subunit J
MEMVAFAILAIIAVVAGVGVIAQRSAVRSALMLLVNFCALAGLYILLNAQFVAVVQVIVYAGAIVVIFLFVVMHLGMERADESRKPSASGGNLRRYQWMVAVLLGAVLLVGIAWTLIPTGAETIPRLIRTDNVGEIGAALLTDFAIPFELTSLVLLVAIIGTVVLAKHKQED